MTPTRPIPDIARIVAVYIRQQVPRPSELPACIYISSNKVTPLAWPADRDKTIKGRCPFGLLPKAMSPWPTSVKDFRGGVPFSQKEMLEFYKWWDEQEDALAAVDAVWGPETKEDNNGL